MTATWNMPWETQSQSIHPLLDQFKKAWMSVPNDTEVSELKESLRKQVEQEHEKKYPGTIEYFLGQCWQIEQRWPRANVVKVDFKKK